MQMSYFWSRTFWTSRPVLWTLFIVNLLGTAYGYEWYWNQLVYTSRSGHPLWQLVFVPDSPTASLFFTLSLLYLIFRPAAPPRTVVRAFVEALGAVASIKYGIWAVVMIFAGAAQGDILEWQHWMLVVSHLSMAVEAVIFASFLSFGRVAALAAACWLFINDAVDYSYGIYPWLPDVLDDNVPAICVFTVGLTVFSLLLVYLLVIFRRIRQKEESGLIQEVPS
ncbi:DUF1405 domain-containing protein [Paenibacillus beijingensis]|uniref:DUF1405 domain-containing protein n=1 Tax=Paenibacillus beijingensis TaxID=1126833 RepID=A0A0D5NPH2_9BACL|nr:DUF1405 domain-containing protein [Paenibacillus beijingensis]AJY77146.1 hypothetical protein VN24_24610 [Paenibacillus beijingensis]